MIFRQTPFALTFVTKEYETETSDHLFTLVYSFQSPETSLRYLVRAEYHEGHVFGIKFYPKNFQLSNLKYSLSVNRGHSLRIFLTCASVIPLLLKEYPDVNFGAIGVRGVGKDENTVEPPSQTRRYRIYSHIFLELIGNEQFSHFLYPENSGILLVNNRTEDIEGKKSEIEHIFYKNYTFIHDI